MVLGLVHSFNFFIFFNKFFKNWFIAILVSTSFIYFSFIFLNLSFLKIVSGWIAFGLFVF